MGLSMSRKTRYAWANLPDTTRQVERGVVLVQGFVHAAEGSLAQT
jgi:hypothetical protein